MTLTKKDKEWIDDQLFTRLSILFTILIIFGGLYAVGHYYEYHNQPQLEKICWEEDVVEEFKFESDTFFKCYENNDFLLIDCDEGISVWEHDELNIKCVGMCPNAISGCNYLGYKKEYDRVVKNMFNTCRIGYKGKKCEYQIDGVPLKDLVEDGE